MLVAAAGCSPFPATPPLPTSEPTPDSKPPTDYAALEAEIEKAITTGPATLDNVRAVLVSVDGETKIAHYRHGFTAGDHGHVFSVTKSMISILIGIAIGDGLIASMTSQDGELPGRCICRSRVARYDCTYRPTTATGRQELCWSLRSPGSRSGSTSCTAGNIRS